MALVAFLCWCDIRTPLSNPTFPNKNAIPSNVVYFLLQNKNMPKKGVKTSFNYLGRNVGQRGWWDKYNFYFNFSRFKDRKNLISHKILKFSAFVNTIAQTSYINSILTVDDIQNLIFCEFFNIPVLKNTRNFKIL